MFALSLRSIGVALKDWTCLYPDHSLTTQVLTFQSNIICCNETLQLFQVI